jgi:hypothetical protein
LNPLQGENYYAMVSISDKGVMSWEFEADKNFTTKGVLVQEPQKLEIDSPINYTYYDFFRSINAKRVSSGIRIFWHFSDYIPTEMENTIIYLIRTEEIPLNFEILKKKGTIIDQFFTKEKKSSFMDKRTNGLGPFYYTLVVGKEANKVITMEFIEGVNVFIKGISMSSKIEKDTEMDSIALEKKRNGEPPTSHKKKRTEELAEDNGSLLSINNILNDFFYHDEFKRAYKALIPHAKSNDPLIKGKALLYQGRCLYKMGFYKESLRYFLNEYVKKYYRSDALFWSKSAYKKIRINQ